MTRDPGPVEHKLEPGLEPLDFERIVTGIGNRRLIPRIAFLLDSTNTRLAALRAGGDPVRVLLAEGQRAGRGRRGRHWLSPPGRGLYLSMARSFSSSLRELDGLALVAGLAAADAIAEHAGVEVQLKWPNDLQIDGRKLGGCLIDLTPARSSVSEAIIGIGINVDFRGLEGPEQAWTDLIEHAPRVDRSALAVSLINALDRNLDRFQAQGFAPFAARWAARDALAGRDVFLLAPDGTPTEARVCGIDSHGQLIVETSGKTARIRAGEVSLRPR